MKHIHPDYVVGEPVPEVEPLVNEEVLVQSLAWIRFSRWVIASLLVLMVFFAIVQVSMMVRYITIGLCYFSFIGWALRPSAREMRKNRKKHAADKWSIPLRVIILFQIQLVIMIVLFQMLLAAGNGLSGMSSYIGIFMLMGGPGLIYTGLRAREPGQICCDKCSYELVGLTLPCQCPECGTWLLDLSSITDRPRVRSPWFFRIGIPLIPFGLAILVLGVVRPSAFYGPVPKSVLIPLAVTDRGAFEQLMTKGLNEEEQNRLENGVIDAYERGGRVPVYGQGRWMSDQAEAGLLDGEQLDRIFEQIEDIWIDADEVAKVGDAVELRLGIENKFFLSVYMYPAYYFNGFLIDDDSYAGSDQARHWVSLKYQDEHRNRQGPPKYVFVPEAVGEVIIQSRVVLVYYDAVAGGAATFAWGEDGEPVFEPEPIWYRVIDLEHTIVIKP